MSRRDALNADPRDARMVASTPIITRTGGYGAVYVSGADSARATVKRYAREGFDLIKIAIEDDLQGRRWPMLDAAEVNALVEAAHAAGKRVSAHVTHARNLALAVDAGVDDIAHMVVEPISEETARRIASKGILWVPTLELWKGVSEAYSLDWIEVAKRNTATFVRAGGRIALGTDYNGYTTHFDSGFPLTEARLLLESGLSPSEVIVAGTRNAAEACGLSADLGTVQRGKVADLLVVRRNPLEDITALAEPEQVYKSGLPVLTGASEPAAVPADDLASLDASIPQIMKQQQVPGLAVAITDDKGTLWSKAYGRTDWRRGRAVDQDTIFGALPGSGAITATAVLMACRDGLVDLDAPISSYLPGFRINSVFQEHPERAITLRQLLRGTAGLPQEAPYGNNYDLNAVDVSKHRESISEAWLRFPAGMNWAYSNLGLDLAAYVLQERSGMPYPQYVDKVVFAPLGMKRATFDPDSILADTNRAIGHQPFQSSVPPIVPMMGAGGAYASASDLAKLVRFHLGRGAFDGDRLVDEKWLLPMYALDPTAGSAGLGVFKSFLTLQGHNRTFGFGTSGGGFGFLNAMLWYPRLGIGGVVLSSSGGGSMAWEVLNQALDAVIDDPRTVYHDRLAAIAENDPQGGLPQGDPVGSLASENRLRLSRIVGRHSPEWATAWS
ncbi:MAG TPA: serine hydrolase, partial [Spirochaetia bacterium]|nr:serine hydrolase [Spirochaetia bacterium]